MRDAVYNDETEARMTGPGPLLHRIRVSPRSRETRDWRSVPDHKVERASVDDAGLHCERRSCGGAVVPGPERELLRARPGRYPAKVGVDKAVSGDYGAVVSCDRDAVGKVARRGGRRELVSGEAPLVGPGAAERGPGERSN